MPKIARHIRVGIAGMLCVLVGAMPIYAAATSASPTFVSVEAPDVLITEFQTNGGSASQEFIELYNTTDEDIVLDQWKLQFFNSTSVKTGVPTWTTATSSTNSVPLNGVIPAHDYFLISSTDYQPNGVVPDMIYSASSSHLMTDTGGGLQLLSIDTTLSSTTAHDRVMWLAQSGTTPLPQGVLASPGSGKSLQRIPNDDTEYVAADGIVSEFGPEDAITPLDAWKAPVIEEVVPVETLVDNATSEPLALAPVSNEGLTPPTITELLPNPATPLTDADDEFIELYNANTAAFDLEGYKLEVGTTTLHTYIFPAGTIIEPLSYLAFYSADTGLSLTNSGGQARFRSPAGVVLSETTAYTDAKDNQAWIFNEGTWQWTTSATPSVANILAAPVVATKATKAATAKTTTKKATTKTAAKAKTTKAKAAAKIKAPKKKASTVKSAASIAPEKPKPPIHMGILVGVASLAVLYGLYEYRHDIAHKFRQLGRNRKAGVADRLAPAGR